MSVAFDTNVLIYAVDRSAGSRHLLASPLIERALRKRGGMLILQTLAEFYSVTTGKLKARPEDALRFLDRLRAVLAVHAAPPSRTSIGRPKATSTICPSGMPCFGQRPIASAFAGC